MQKTYKNLIISLSISLLISGCAIKKDDDLLTKTAKYTVNAPITAITVTGITIETTLQVALGGIGYVLHGGKKEFDDKKEKEIRKIVLNDYKSKYYDKFINSKKNKEIYSISFSKNNDYLNKKNIKSRILDEFYKSEFISDYILSSLSKGNLIGVYSKELNLSIIAIKEKALSKEILSGSINKDGMLIPILIEYDKNNNVVSTLINYARYNKYTEKPTFAGANFILYKNKEVLFLNEKAWKSIIDSYYIYGIRKKTI